MSNASLIIFKGIISSINNKNDAMIAATWLFASITTRCLSSHRKKNVNENLNCIDKGNQRTSITFATILVVLVAIAIAIQICSSGKEMLLFPDNHDRSSIGITTLFFQCVLMYQWEMTHRIKNRILLLIHYVCCFLLVQKVSASIDHDAKWMFCRFALLLGLQTMTTALLSYGIGSSCQSEIIIKSAIMMISIVYFVFEMIRNSTNNDDNNSTQDDAYRLLFTTQVFASFVLVAMGGKPDNNDDDGSSKEEEAMLASLLVDSREKERSLSHVGWLQKIQNIA